MCLTKCVPMTCAQYSADNTDAVVTGQLHEVRWSCAQLAILVLLWAAFLFTQMEKAKYPRCSWQFAAIFAFQTVMLAGVTLAALHYESYKFKVGRYP